MIEGQRIKPWSDRSGPRAVDSIYGHWDRDPKGDFVLPAYVGYSDYSGSLVERSNLETFIGQFADYEDVEWWDVHGGHGTRALVLRVDADERVPEIGEFFEGLENYPLADEEHHSELEMEATNEAWLDYGLNEWIRGFDDLFGHDPLETDEELTYDEESIRDGLTRFYWAMSDLYGQYPEVENAAGSVAFHLDGILSHLQEFVDDINAAGEVGTPEERAESEAGEFGPKAFEELMSGALYGPNADPRQFEYRGFIYKILSAHRDLRGARRLVFTDFLRENGLEAGLQYLEKQK